MNFQSKTNTGCEGDAGRKSRDSVQMKVVLSLSVQSAGGLVVTVFVFVVSSLDTHIHVQLFPN